MGVSTAAQSESEGADRHLLQRLRWQDGFVLAMAGGPAGIFAVLGYSIGVLGVWSALALWAIATTIGALQAVIYAEQATMFPDKPGIALYAGEGWKQRFSLVGPVAAFGYWFAWSSALAIYGLLIGTLIQAQWFPDETWTFSTGLADVGLPHMIAVGALIAVWLLNFFGVKPAVWFGYLVCALLVVPFAIFIVLPYISGDWSSANATWGLGDVDQPWRVALVWLFVMGWNAYSPEAAATFAPEYRDPRRDTVKALKVAGLVTIALWTLTTVGLGGTVGSDVLAEDAIGGYVTAFDKVVGGGSNVAVALLVLAMFLVINACTADSSRALWGMGRQGISLKQLDHLNKHHMPGRAMTVDLVLNIALVLFVGEVLAILVAGNLGYFLAHFFALTGFLWLRRDRPGWPRPFKLGRPWLYVAGVLAAIDLTLIGFGVTGYEISGYGGTKELLIGLGVLALSLILYWYRVVVQDRRSLVLREDPDVV
jgi:amino acid transporter